MFDEPDSPANLAKSMGKATRGKFLMSSYTYSYITQIQELHKLRAKSIIEVGPGEEFTANSLRMLGVRYDTLDRCDFYGSTIIEDFATFDPEPYSKSYEATCAFQVLEHFPYDKFTYLLDKLVLMSSGHILISLPYSCKGTRTTTLNWKGQVPTKENKTEKFTATGLPNRKYRPEFIKEFPYAVHYWEIGRQGFPLSKVFKDIENCGLKIDDHFHGPNPYHYFIRAKKIAA